MGRRLTRAVAFGAVLVAVGVTAFVAVGPAAHPTAATKVPAARETAVVAPSATVGAAVSQEQAIVNAAASQADVPYCDGGGGIDGPSCTHGPAGYDCMSLAQYAVYQATGILIPSTGSPLGGKGTYIPPVPNDPTDGLMPGDVVFWDHTGDIADYQHSGVYAGNGEVWDAFDVGYPVETHSFTFLEGSYAYDGAIRYWTSGATVLSIKTTSLPAGTVSTSSHPVTYSATLKAKGGFTPYAWKLSNGSTPLPPGLTLSVAGVISGKATKAGTFGFTVRVKDSAGGKVAKALSIAIS